MAILVEMAKSRDKMLMTPNQCRAAVEACSKYGLFLVDEAMTAIRCGHLTLTKFLSTELMDALICSYLGRAFTTAAQLFIGKALTGNLME